VPATAYLLLGSNLGDREHQMDKARTLIAKDIGAITQTSPVYETEPWGYNDQPTFLNQAMEVSTALSPQELAKRLREIEGVIGRSERAHRYGARQIDIDLLLYGSEIIHEEGLVVPHPRLHLRRFVLVPLSTIAPDTMHPVFNKPITQLLDACEDRLGVTLHDAV